MKRVIINGAAGFIGNAIARQLIGQGISVVAVVKPGIFHSDEAFRLEDFNAPIIECDLREIEKLPKLIQEREYDAFYQLAWDGLDREGIVNCDRQIDNIKWTIKSIEAAVSLKCRKFIGAGSINQTELLEQKGRFFTQDRHKYYRAALFASECMGRGIAKEKHIEFIWPIIINVYGEGEIAPRLVNSTIRNLLAGKHQSFSTGEQLYDFIHIEDAARAFCLIGEMGKEETQYIIGSGTPKPLKVYLEIIKDIVAPEMVLGLGELEYHGVEVPNVMFDTSLLTNDTGFVPKIDFKSGIKRTLKWIRQGD